MADSWEFLNENSQWPWMALHEEVKPNSYSFNTRSKLNLLTTDHSNGKNKMLKMLFIITNSNNQHKHTLNLLILQHPIHASTGHLASSVDLNVLCQSHPFLFSTRHIHGVPFRLLPYGTPYLTDPVVPDVVPQPAATTFTT